MKVSSVYAWQASMSFPLSREDFGKKKLYTVSREDNAVHAVIIDEVVINLIYSPMGSIHNQVIDGNRTTTGQAIIYRCRVATKEGIKHVEIPLSPYSCQGRFYLNPTDAAEGNAIKSVKFDKGTIEMGYILYHAFADSSRGDDIVMEEIDTGLVKFGYYVWDGFKPVFKSIEMGDNKSVIISADGCKFDVEPKFDDIDWDNTYTTEESCRNANSIEIFDFSF